MMNYDQLNSLWDAIALQPKPIPAVTEAGSGDMASVYHVSDFASMATGLAGAAISDLVTHAGDAASAPKVLVDRRRSSLWFDFSMRPVDWQLPPSWDALAGDYQTKDGWIRLHTNAPKHRKAVEKVLGKHVEKKALALTVSGLKKTELEQAVIEAGGCAAAMRSFDEWSAHPQGIAVAGEPLAIMRAMDLTTQSSWRPDPVRPLKGVRVLDLTRILAGPVATRFLAAFGADVLRIDPPEWEELSVIPEVALGKRLARLDLKLEQDRETFRALLAQTDILVHGYRPGVLDALGFGPNERNKIRPGLIDVSLCAYGYSGPWAARRGFDSLVQMSTGIADRGMRWKKVNWPTPLPCQALDFATGYFMAAASIRALSHRLQCGRGTQVQFSLARTAHELMNLKQGQAQSEMISETPDDIGLEIENTAWGKARRLKPPVLIEGVPMRWDLPANPIGSSNAVWKS